MIWWKYNDALFSNFEIDAMDCTKYVLLFLKEHTVTCNALLVDHGRCHIMSSRLERSSAQLRTIDFCNAKFVFLQANAPSESNSAVENRWGITTMSGLILTQLLRRTHIKLTQCGLNQLSAHIEISNFISSSSWYSSGISIQVWEIGEALADANWEVRYCTMGKALFKVHQTPHLQLFHFFTDPVIIWEIFVVIKVHSQCTALGWIIDLRWVRGGNRMSVSCMDIISICQ